MLLDVFPIARDRQHGAAFFVAVLISSLLLFQTSTSAATDADLSAFEGHWQQIETTEGDAARETAIDDAISNLTWIVRTMARGVLRRTTKPPPELQFAWDGERLHQGISTDDGGFSRVVELDGELITLQDNRGVDFASSWAWADGGLRLRWEQHQAVGNNTYRLDDEGETLTVQHTIKITAMSNIDPIIYVSRFSRTDLPARGAAGGHVYAHRH